MNPPRFKVPAKWGLCFDGNEAAFCSALDLAADQTTTRPFRYLEIGLGYGDGMRAVQFYMAQHSLSCVYVGVDIATCHPSASEPARYMLPDVTRIHLCGASEYFKRYTDPINVAFIDGCHGAACVKADFLGVERLIVPRGIVIFHDTDQGCQGLHFQPHCGTGIDAREALRNLGLLDARPGWKLIAETSGNKDKAGHGITVVQRDDV